MCPPQRSHEATGLDLCPFHQSTRLFLHSSTKSLHFSSMIVCYCVWIIIGGITKMKNGRTDQRGESQIEMATLVCSKRDTINTYLCSYIKTSGTSKNFRAIITRIDKVFSGCIKSTLGKLGLSRVQPKGSLDSLVGGISSEGNKNSLDGHKNCHFL